MWSPLCVQLYHVSHSRHKQPVNWTGSMKTVAEYVLLRLLPYVQKLCRPRQQKLCHASGCCIFYSPDTAHCSMKPCGGWPLTCGTQSDNTGRHSPHAWTCWALVRRMNHWQSDSLVFFKKNPAGLNIIYSGHPKCAVQCRSCSECSVRNKLKIKKIIHRESFSLDKFY